MTGEYQFHRWQPRKDESPDEFRARLVGDLAGYGHPWDLLDVTVMVVGTYGGSAEARDTVWQLAKERERGRVADVWTSDPSYRLKP